MFTGGLVAGCTTAVAAEFTGPADPAVFEPVTPAISVDPTSAVTNVYVELCAAAIGEHEVPELLQRDH